MNFGGLDMPLKSIDEELMAGQKMDCVGRILKMKVGQVEYTFRTTCWGGSTQYIFVLKFFRPKK